MNNKIFLITIVFIFVVGNVFALGVSPGRTTIDFSPGMEHTVSFSIKNSEAKDIDLVVASQGELKENILIGENAFSMAADESHKQISYTVNLPSELTPGLHTADIVILQLPDKFVETGEASVGASIAVVTQLHVNVPYPGKYAEANLNVIGPDKNGKVTFAIPVTSKGEFDLISVKADIEIYSSLNKKIATLKTNEVSIPSKARKELVAEWDSSEIQPGPYRAIAAVVYDEKTLSVEKEFDLGTKKLTLEDIRVSDFTLGEIAKFEVLVKNHWSETIEGAYAQMEIFNSKGNLLADFKSQTYDVNSLEKSLMVAFWDTKGVKEGTYDANLYLRYGESSEQQNLKLDVSKNKISIVGVGYVISSDEGSKFGDSGLVFILIILIVLLIMINLLWFFFFRRKFGRGNK